LSELETNAHAYRLRKLPKLSEYGAASILADRQWKGEECVANESDSVDM
jgi:hypothetical protein